MKLLKVGFSCIEFGWMKQDFACILDSGTKLAQASMRKSLDPESWQCQEVLTLVVISDPRMKGDNCFFGDFTHVYFIRLSCWFTEVEKDTCVSLR